MKQRFFIGLNLIAILIFGALNFTAAGSRVELNVSAAISLKDALLEIQKLYRQIRPNLNVNINLGSSGSLQAQIEQGAPADIFISAATKQMNALEKKNLLVKGSRRNIVENQLVLIIPKDSALRINHLQDLTMDNIGLIGIGAPESAPAGQYALETFQSLGIWKRLQNKVVFGTNVRAVLAYVETGNIDVGMVYGTDAMISSQVKIVMVIPAGFHEPIVYPAAILANARQPKAAVDFLNYLTSPAGKAVFEKYGFVVKR